MADDRYAPPEAPLVDEAALLTNGNGEFDIGESLSEGWSATWPNFPLWLGVSIVGVALMGLSALTVIGMFLVVPVLAWGMIRFQLNMIDGDPRFSDLFEGFSNYGQTMLTMLIAGTLMMGVNMLGGLVQIVGTFLESQVLTVLGALLSYAWTLLVFDRFYFTLYYVVDQDLGPVEAMQASWDATSEQKLRLIGLVIMNSVVILVGVLALLVGVIPAACVAGLMWVSAYRQMVGRPQVGNAVS